MTPYKSICEECSGEGCSECGGSGEDFHDVDIYG